MQRTYLIYSQAWWIESDPLSDYGLVDRVRFRLYDDDGGCVGDGAVSWHGFGHPVGSPRLEVFHDGWGMLAALADEGFFDQFGQLDTGSDPTVEAVCEVLELFGFEDTTPRAAPTDETSGT